MIAGYSLLTVGPVPADLARSPWGPFQAVACADLESAAAALRERHFDAIWLAFANEDEALRLSAWPALSQAVLDGALVVSWPQPSAAAALQLVTRGVHDVLPHDEATAGPVARALRLGIERKILETAARKAHATDLATGLPNHAQLLEHMTHLLALREREPAPMALLVLRVDGLATVAAQVGVEAANVLRRKAAVRLRAGLRASDVVAAIGTDTFAVLLAWIDESGAGQRVAAKLAQALQQPFTVAGTSAVLAVSVGVSDYPEHGRDADALLRRAVGQSAERVGVGRAGFANRVERGPATAANDEPPRLA
jgi:diguanylate cyclase (GGDEF)-like protein